MLNSHSLLAQMAFNKACVVGLEPIREVISLGAIAGQSLI